MKTFIGFLMVGVLVLGAGCKKKTPVAEAPAATSQQAPVTASAPATTSSARPQAGQPKAAAPVLIKVFGTTNRVPMVP
jgi:3-oxoacyl-ACP reductase-like protein